MVSFASPHSFFYFPLHSSSNKIITEISHKKHYEQNLIRCSKEEFNKISLKSKLKNRQINLDLPERFGSNIKDIPYHPGTLNVTNFMKYIMVSHLIQVQVTAYFNGTYTKLAEVMI